MKGYGTRVYRNCLEHQAELTIYRPGFKGSRTSCVLTVNEVDLLIDNEDAAMLLRAWREWPGVTLLRQSNKSRRCLSGN